MQIRKLKNKYYARIAVRQSNSRPPKDKIIPLCTTNRVVAENRLTTVEKFEDELRSGETLIFPWQNDSKPVEVYHLTVKDAIDKYLKSREGDGLRPGTLNVYRTALERFSTSLNKSFAVEDIKLSHINDLKTRYINKHSPHTLNITLRSLKTFLIWLYDNELIKSIPRIKLINCGKSMPIYLSNAEFEQICKYVDGHYKRAYWFYRETGCRLSEPFHGVLNGNFLTISADNAKGHQERDIYLSTELIEILVDIKQHFQNIVDKKRSSERNAINRYSRLFCEACRKVRITDRKFHSLRHTFAVRTYLKTRDIYQVAKCLGHSSVVTTEIYAKFNLMRLEQDFPDIVNDYIIPGKIPQN